MGVLVLSELLKPKSTRTKEWRKGQIQLAGSLPYFCWEVLWQLQWAVKGRSESGPKCLQISLNAKPVWAEGVKLHDGSPTSPVPPPCSLVEVHYLLAFFFPCASSYESSCTQLVPVGKKERVWGSHNRKKKNKKNLNCRRITFYLYKIWPF